MGHATSSDPNIFILPDLGEGVHEAELIAWKVAVGDTVEEHQTLAEMETDKALVEVPSPRAGVIASLNGREGEICKVGDVLVTYEGASNGAAPSPNARDERSESRDSSALPEAEREDAGTVVGSVSNDPIMPSQGGKALATPAVRRLARDLGVNIDSIAGTGLAGRVTEKDVRAASNGAPGAPASAPPPSPSGRGPGRGATATLAPSQPAPTYSPPPSLPAPAAGQTQRIPFRGTRRTIAARLRQSIDTAVHFTVMDEADVSALDALRKQTAAASGESVSFLPFVISAICRAVKHFPALNATVDEAAQEILRHPSVHMGIATDTEHGLNVPVIPDADALGVLEIGRHVAQLAQMARDRSIPRERLMGSTITISNVGSYAGRFATPVINIPEVAILAVGRVREGVVVRNGGLHVGKLMPLSLACDHRVVDGAEAARCLALIVELLQSPEQLLAPARR
ncbi:MAG: 2-oxo acid dehydrogenase subunit E2 [Phycisphaeraceae bacterium]|nr:2-oxo acid dehydrogenase subunit E2 [Phycisphaeraceae bacterium]MCB9848065.1 2-oxo acid dehydrogenase subunit E2 [Phycisphaeraceae bacterium]